MKNLYKICGAIIIASWAATIVVTCTSSCSQVTRAGRAVIDCTRSDEQRIAVLIAEFVPLVVGDAPNWMAVETKAIDAGREIGGCALAEFVQGFLVAASTEAFAALPISESARAARATFEDFRTRVGDGATFHTRRGEL